MRENIQRSVFVDIVHDDHQVLKELFQGGGPAGTRRVAKPAEVEQVYIEVLLGKLEGDFAIARRVLTKAVDEEERAAGGRDRIAPHICEVNYRIVLVVTDHFACDNDVVDGPISD